MRDLLEDLRRRINHVAALTSAVAAFSSVTSQNKAQAERIHALAQVAEEFADESVAIADRCLSQLSRNASI
jgi:hypothetical protein